MRKRLDHHVLPNVKHGTFYQNQKELEKAVPVLQKIVEHLKGPAT